MKSVGAREANQQFSKLLRRAEAGEEIIITRNGRTVARLVPAAGAKSPAEREIAMLRLVDFLKRHARPLGVAPVNRDELYDR